MFSNVKINFIIWKVWIVVHVWPSGYQGMLCYSKVFFCFCFIPVKFFMICCKLYHIPTFQKSVQSLSSGTHGNAELGTFNLFDLNVVSLGHILGLALEILDQVR